MKEFDLSLLKTKSRNPRKISDFEMARLKRSVSEFEKMLPLRPIIYDPITMEVIGGNMRLTALKSLGKTLIPENWVKSAEGLTEDEKKQFVITDNNLFGEWDMELLMEDYTPDELGNFGFDMEHYEDFIKKSQKNYTADEDDFEIDENTQTDLILGDVIDIGRHRLMCGDSTKPEDVNKLMNGSVADMVFTDPPYNVKIDSIVNLGKTKHKEFAMASGEMSKIEFISFLKSAFGNLKNNSKNGSIHYICMDWKHIEEIITAGAIFDEFKNLCIWNKDNGGMGTFYRSKHELVFVYKNGTNKNTNNFELGQHGRYRTNVWDYAGVNSFTNRERIDNTSKGKSDLDMHPTVKPVKMVGDAILDVSNVNEVVLDLFGGSGTTMVACEQLERSGYLMEYSPIYCQVIIDRMKVLNKEITVKVNGILV